ncbi:MAG TPA: hypothetical protein VFE47_10605 [Tepidisphaeraceae bacterium]|nr:hypothetical protein [Tepidisphaeraceae bacterium]
MPKLGPFPTTARDYEHPLLRFLDRTQPERAEIEVVRPKDVLGFKSARLYLHFAKNGVAQAPAEYLWDDELNLALINRGIKSASPESEEIRFGLYLRYKLKRTESRYGDGFFNSVLILVIRELKFELFPEVEKILGQIHTNKPDPGGSSLDDCRNAISTILGKAVEELTKRLQYPEAQADEILAGAVAKYLDERFTVSDRIRLGWT